MNELSKEQSEEFAARFELFKMAIHSIDWDYARLIVEGLRDQAGWQEAAAVLNQNYSQTKTDLVRLQANALGKFVEAVELLKKCDELKKEISGEENHRNEIQKLFL